MNRPIQLVLTLAVALTAGVATTMSGCTQPLMNCTSAHGTFAAKFELVEGDPNTACGSLVGDVLGFQSYYYEGGLNDTPDYNRAKVAIRPETLGLLLEHAVSQGVPVADAEPNAIGDFAAGLPTEDEFCEIPRFQQHSEANIPLVPAVPDDPETPDEDESIPEQPATYLKYEWKNAKVLVSADAQGTQFAADLRFTQDNCTADYRVTGLYPLVGCESDDDCTADDNGINPSFSKECLTELGICVLTGEPPAYKE